MNRLEWVKLNSPPAYLMLSLPANWEIAAGGMDEERVAEIFCRHWNQVKSFLAMQNMREGMKSLDDYQVPFLNADMVDDLSMDFFNLLQSVDGYLTNTGRFQEMVDFCQDMLDLFLWDEYDTSRWVGLKGDGLWRMDSAKGEAYFKEHLVGYNETIMGYYSFNLLREERWADAAEALKDYKRSKDTIIRERFLWLKKRK